MRFQAAESFQGDQIGCVVMRVVGSIQRLAQRHMMPIWKAVPYEVFIRLYENKYFRLLSRLFFSKETPKGYFFLVGCYNAGTTVVKNAIAAHPDVSMAPVEGDMLTDGLSSFEEGGWPRAMYGNLYRIAQHRKNDELDVDALISDWRPWIKSNKYFFEKSISQSVRIKLLRKTFPQSKFICVTRDPGSVVKGILKRSHPREVARRILGGAEYPESFLYKQWAFIYECILSDYCADDTVFCQYDGFIESPVKTVQKLFSFLGLRDVEVIFKDGVLEIDGVPILIRPLSNEFIEHKNIRAWIEGEIKQIHSEQG